MYNINVLYLCECGQEYIGNYDIKELECIICGEIVKREELSEEDLINAGAIEK